MANCTHCATTLPTAATQCSWCGSAVKPETHLEGFLREYHALCERYKLKVDGCGCCGSPYVANEDGIYVAPVEGE